MNAKPMTAVLAAAAFASLIVPARADTSDFGSPHVETGYASYYALARNHMRTASGESEDPTALTAAHASLPLGSWVKVTNLVNGRSVNVRINDRNAPSGHRLIDLSRRAASLVGLMRAGIAKVRIELLPPHRASLSDTRVASAR